MSGPCLKTWGGLVAPIHGLGKVSIVDMAVHLGRTSRFGKFGVVEWTVLHHLFLVAMIWTRAGFPLAELIYPLLHDGHEYLTGDLPKPIKVALRMFLAPESVDPIKSLEHAVDQRIFDHLQIEPPKAGTKERIKLCDCAALLIESALFGPPTNAAQILAAEFSPDYFEAVQHLVDKTCPELSELVANREASPR